MVSELQLSATRPSPELAAQAFPGQQEGERVLYVIQSHWSREFMYAVKVVLAVGGVIALRFLVGDLLPLSEESLVRGYIITALVGALSLLYFRFYCQNSRAYITDRRIIRFEGAILSFQTRRALFWGDVIKIQSKTPTWILQFFKIGHLSVIPNHSPTTQDVTVRFVYYYEDLAAYLEKVLFTFRSKPQEMDAIRPFVAKPRGQRYPAENTVSSQ